MRILLPEDEPLADLYDYPAPPAVAVRIAYSIPYPSFRLGKRPGIIPPRGIDLDARARALSPKMINPLSLNADCELKGPFLFKNVQAMTSILAAIFTSILVGD
jgi:hypothetical protein